MEKIVMGAIAAIGLAWADAAQATIIASNQPGDQPVVVGSGSTAKSIDIGYLLTFDTVSGKVDACYMFPNAAGNGSVQGCKQIGIYANPVSNVQIVSAKQGMAIVNPSNGHTVVCLMPNSATVSSYPTAVVGGSCTQVAATLPQ